MIVITQDTMGDLKFPAAYGSLLFVEALGVMLGPPVAGILKDISGNYDSSLYISGSLLIISGIKIKEMTRHRVLGSFEVIYLNFSIIPSAPSSCKTTIRSSTKIRITIVSAVRRSRSRSSRSTSQSNH